MRIIIVSFLLCLSNPALAADVLIDVAGGEKDPYADLKDSDLGSPMNIQMNLGQVQEAFDDSSPEANVIHFKWSQNHIAKVRLRRNMRTLIHLPQEEKIKAYTLGDQTYFMATPIKNIPYLLSIVGQMPGTDTNLTIVSDSGRVYNFYMRTDPVDSRFVPHFTVFVEVPELTAMHAVQFDEKGMQKQGEGKRFISQEELEELSEPEIDYLKTLPNVDRVNLEYKMYGDEIIAPDAVWDDGRWTYFDFRSGLKTGSLPSVYKVMDDRDNLDNVRFKNGYLIAESISPEGWTIRLGEKSVCIKPTKEIIPAKVTIDG
jgi:type IV secretory pathway VirB9-like protein